MCVCVRARILTVHDVLRDRHRFHTAAEHADVKTRADTFTCSQRYTFTPAGLAMTLQTVFPKVGPGFYSVPVQSGWGGGRVFLAAYSHFVI